MKSIFRRTLLVSALLLTLSACTSTRPGSVSDSSMAADVSQLGEIVDLRSGQRLSAEQLVAQLAAAPRLIVGEQHDQLSHHQIEQWLAQQLQARRAQGSVLLEMLNPDQQAKVDKVKPWLQTDPVVRPEHVAGLLAWQPGWKWEQYGELVMTLMRAPYPLWSANLDRSEVRQIFADKPMLQGQQAVLSSASGVQDRLKDIIRVMHDNQIDEPRLAAMLSVQQQRDRRMAERLLAAPAPALLIAGAYHAHKDLGVPLHVRDLTGGSAPLVLVLAPRGAEVGAAQADFAWYTPVVPVVPATPATAGSR